MIGVVGVHIVFLVYLECGCALFVVGMVLVGLELVVELECCIFENFVIVLLVVSGDSV